MSTDDEDAMTTFLIRFEAPPMSADRQTDGSTVIYDARIVIPEQWAGQVRDLTIRPDGSIHLGEDHAPSEGRPRVTLATPHERSDGHRCNPVGPCDVDP